MAAVEINITLGSLRQPGMWGKILIPWNGSIYELNEERGYELSAKGQTRMLKWEDVADAAYIILGLRGASDQHIRERLFDKDVLFLTHDEDFLFDRPPAAIVVLFASAAVPAARRARRGVAASGSRSDPESKAGASFRVDG